MKPFEPLPPPDSDDPGDFTAWMDATAERFAVWKAETDRELKRLELVNSFLRIIMPTILVALGLYWASRRQWFNAIWDWSLAAFNVWFSFWIDRRTARRIAERKAQYNAIMAEIERDNPLP